MPPWSGSKKCSGRSVSCECPRQAGCRSSPRRATPPRPRHWRAGRGPAAASEDARFGAEEESFVGHGSRDALVADSRQAPVRAVDGRLVVNIQPCRRYPAPIESLPRPCCAAIWRHVRGRPHRRDRARRGDDASRGADVERERTAALRDLAQDSSFVPLRGGRPRARGPVVAAAGGAGRAAAHRAERRRGQARRASLALGLARFRRVVREYFAICDSYYKALRQASARELETVDMARRAIHDRATRQLLEALEGKVEIDCRHRAAALYADLRAPYQGLKGGRSKEAMGRKRAFGWRWRMAGAVVLAALVAGGVGLVALAALAAGARRRFRCRASDRRRRRAGRFPRLQAIGARFAYLEASDGAAARDPAFAAQPRRSRAAGLRIRRGAPLRPVRSGRQAGGQLRHHRPARRGDAAAGDRTRQAGRSTARRGSARRGSRAS